MVGPAAKSERRVVLVVDDNRFVLTTLVRGLEQFLPQHGRYEVTQAAGAEVAIASINRDHPYALVTDMHMPGNATAGLDVLAATIPYKMVRILCCEDASAWLRQARAAAGNKRVVAFGAPTNVERLAAFIANEPPD